MKKLSIFLLGILLSPLFMACNSEKAEDTTEESTATDIAYKIAKNYFIKNDVEGVVPEKITSQEEFEKYFGMAATMGEDGTPTPIDFGNEYVIVADLNTTTRNVALHPVSLVLQDGTLNLKYTAAQGEELGFASRPFLMLVVANALQGDVVLTDVTGE